MTTGSNQPKVSGVGVQVSVQPLAAEPASLFEKETLVLHSIIQKENAEILPEVDKYRIARLLNCVQNEL